MTYIYQSDFFNPFLASHYCHVNNQQNTSKKENCGSIEKYAQCELWIYLSYPNYRTSFMNILIFGIAGKKSTNNSS